ncbi:zinc metalloprotease [Lysobacter humi (ex Lee et al. 2017)]
MLAANSDGTKATGEWIDGKLVPKAPFLRAGNGGPNLVTEDYKGDYIRQWVAITNSVLAGSGAGFRLDSNIVFVEEKNSTLNAATDGDAINAFFKGKRADTTASNPYAKRLIMLFAWGTGDQPSGGGASDIRASYVLMPAKVDGGTQIQGEPVPGWYMMAHELGHHLGLRHTFADGPRDIFEQLAQGRTLTGLSAVADGGVVPTWGPVPAAADYGPHTPSAATKKLVDEYYNKWPYSFDQDQFDVVDEVSGEVLARGVKDTGIDLGLGLAPYLSKGSCEAVSNVSIGPLTGIDNSVNRRNPMSYTLCPASQLSFSPDQVTVMTETLARPSHKVFVTTKTTKSWKCSPPQWNTGPGRVKPGEPVMKRRLPGPVWPERQRSSR